MSKEAFRLQLRIQLGEVTKRIAEADQHLSQGTPEERVHAAGELMVLRRREAAIAAKIAKLEHEPDGVWESLKTEIEEDLEAVSGALRRLFGGV